MNENETTRLKERKEEKRSQEIEVGPQLDQLWSTDGALNALMTIRVYCFTASDPHS
jgi:hypothetical protein